MTPLLGAHPSHRQQARAEDARDGDVYGAKKLQKGETFRRKDNQLGLWHKAKKDVFLWSTKHRESECGQGLPRQHEADVQTGAGQQDEGCRPVRIRCRPGVSDANNKTWVGWINRISFCSHTTAAESLRSGPKNCSSISRIVCMQCVHLGQEEWS